jgi:hypothetical protein
MIVSSSRRRWQWGLCCSALFLVSIVSLWHHQRAESSAVNYGDQRLAAIPEKRTNIVVASWFGYHFEVYFALAWTLQRVMSRNVQLRIYGDLPFPFGFHSVIDNLGLYRGEIKDSNNLLDDLTKNVDIDMLILGTCEIECASPFSPVDAPGD